MLKKAKISIKGVKPLLINTFPIDTFSEGRAKEGKAGKNEAEWKRTVLMTAERNLYVHSTYIIGSIKDGGKNVKVGKATLSKKMGSCLDCLEPILLIQDRIVPPDDDITTNAADDVYLDVRAVVNPMTKGRNIRYRVATKPGWKVECTLQWDDTAFSVEQLKEAIRSAGLFEGMGDGRRIGFGKFELVSLELIKD